MQCFSNMWKSRGTNQPRYKKKKKITLVKKNVVEITYRHITPSLLVGKQILKEKTTYTICSVIMTMFYLGFYFSFFFSKCSAVNVSTEAIVYQIAKLCLHVSPLLIQLNYFFVCL